MCPDRPRLRNAIDPCEVRAGSGCVPPGGDAALGSGWSSSRGAAKGNRRARPRDELLHVGCPRHATRSRDGRVERTRRSCPRSGRMGARARQGSWPPRLAAGGNDARARGVSLTRTSQALWAYAPFRRGIRTVSARSTVLVTTDHALQDVVERYLGIPSTAQTVIPNGVDPERCRKLATVERSRAFAGAAPAQPDVASVPLRGAARGQQRLRCGGPGLCTGRRQASGAVGLGAGG